MSQERVFKDLVSLYRGLSCPHLDNGEFIFEGSLGDNLLRLKSLWVDAASMAAFCIKFRDEERSTEFEEDFPDINHFDGVRLAVKVPIGHFQFKSGLSEYLNGANFFNLATMEPNVYLAKEDYLFGEQPNCIDISKVIVISEMIDCLKKLSNFHDKTEVSGLLKLVFVDTTAENGKVTPPIVIEPKIKLTHLESQKLDLTVLNKVLSEDEDNIHVDEKKALFRVSIFEILKGVDNNQDKFDFLVENWSELLELYRGNFEAYITKFSFLKQKREASEAYISLSAKLSGALSSISGKLFGLPVSLGVSLAVYKAEGKLEGGLLVGGVLVTSWLIFVTVLEQRNVISAIKGSIDGIFSHTKSDKKSELSILIRTQKKQLTKQSRKLNRSMWLFMLLSWVPTLSAAYIYIDKFYPNAFHKLYAVVSAFFTL
ncbi:TPA: hypothetical protein ACG0MY_003782 [Serratia marcescens]|uniref:hypothetical protein n=1 Tax=Serratia nevei TaxID=2703794 RepID=UPI00313C1AA2